MSFIGDLFRTEHTESVVLIEVSAESVGGAYAVFAKDEVPTIVYTQRFAIPVHEGEVRERTLLRTLQTLGETLIREGAPILARSTLSGRAGTVVASIDTPWQKTLLRSQKFDPAEPFIFTKKLVDTLLEETSRSVPGKILVDESIVGTTLNGYETRDPYGKRAHRAALVVLTSFIDERLARAVASTLRGVYHTDRVFPIAATSLRFQSLRTAFPHERDVLMVDATGATSSIALVQGGLFTHLADIRETKTYPVWREHVTKELAELAKRYSLPRTIFLLAPEAKAISLQKGLAGLKLFLDKPPKIIPVQASHLSTHVRQAASTPPDLALMLMALFYQHSPPE